MSLAFTLFLSGCHMDNFFTSNGNGSHDGNGPAPDIEPRFTAIEILESIAVVRLEVERWSGKSAGSEVHMSDAFTLVKTDAGWKIAHKIFHWHAQ